MAKPKDDAVVVVRSDGKEFLIKRDLVAEHVNRGFKVKNEADMPSEEELSKAVGYGGPKPDADKGTTGEGNPEGGDEATVPEEKPKARTASSNKDLRRTRAKRR
jgi:hypothetical protein